MIAELPPTNAQQLWNWLVPAGSIGAGLIVAGALWDRVTKRFVSKAEYEVLLKRVDDMQETMSAAAEIRSKKILDRVEDLCESINRKRR
jgi:flagellar biosynthesis/type III secretory pathway M-ring protein FliF/YscJ